MESKIYGNEKFPGARWSGNSVLPLKIPLTSATLSRRPKNAKLFFFGTGVQRPDADVG